MARWTVKTKDDGTYEYDNAHGSVSGGALCLHMDDGAYQFWGPGFWEWAKHEKATIESVPITNLGTGD